MTNDLSQYLPFYIYLALNVSAAFLRRRQSGISPYLYVASLLLLFYDYCFRWFLPGEVAMLLHIAACTFAIIRGGNWLLLPFSLFNLFVMMPFANYGPLELAWFFGEEMHLSVLNALGDASGLCLSFILFILSPILIIKGVKFAVKRRKMNQA